MATVQAFIRISKKNIEKANVRFRLTDGRSVQLFHKSKIEVDPKHWDKKKEQYKSGVLMHEQQKIAFGKSITDRKNILLEVYSKCDKETINSKKFEQLIDESLYPEKYKDKNKESIFDIFDAFMNKSNISKGRKNALLVVKRILQRFELFIAIDEKIPYSLELNKITSETLEKIESFIRNEHELFESHPEIYAAVPETRTPKQRGHNRVVSILSMLRSFIIWANKTKKTNNNPFSNYSIPEEVYGTPIYITLEERNAIYNKDLSSHPALEVQRDIFIFQCLIGCRVGDLLNLKTDNIINEAVEYIPEKTIEGRPQTIRVPLNKIAIDIIDKYKDTDKGTKLLPFISEQKYNTAIKKIFELAEITRIVTVLNPITRKEEKKPINEVASSHLARRTFIGNLYKKVKDPNLVGSLSGHKEGSRAFSRYRDIDEDMKKELIKLLD